jgi:immune inhibitor A
VLKKLILVFILLLIITTHSAQEDEYPTLLALEQAVIPPRNRVKLAQELLGIDNIPPTPDTPQTYEIGQIETFRALNTAANQIFEFEAQLQAIGEHIYIWVDTSAEIDDAEGLAHAFDIEIYPGVRDLWGSEARPGIDNDPRVFALFTYNLGGGIAAYFSSENSYPDEIAPSSNEHEMFIYELGAVGTDLDNWGVQSVTAHEFQHMIRANVNPNPETWFNEGLSVFTQLILGYPDGASAARAYYSAPYTQLNTWAESGTTAPHYGNALLWVTYFYERYGLKALQTASRERTDALTAFNNALEERGEPGVNTLFADWILANWWNDKSLDDGRYGYELIPEGNQPFTEEIDEYPAVIEDDANQYSAEYFQLEDLPEGDTLSMSFTSPETTPLIPTDAQSGEQMWYSNRRDDSATTLTRSFDLSNVTSAELEYNVWYHLENGWDYGYVLLSTDNGETWETLTTPNMTDSNPHGTAYGTGYTGRSRDWLLEGISLDGYVGQVVLIRFAVITDDATNQHGMAIDDVRVEAVGYESDFESNDSGWAAEGWVLIDNVLPQNVWVQVAQKSGEHFQVTRWQYPTNEAMRVPLLQDVETVMVAVSPFAPVTTLGIDYTLEIDIE